MRPGTTPRVVVGQAQMVSTFLSNEWQFIQADQVIASAVRRPRHRYTGVELADGSRWLLQPDGWGVVRAVEGGAPFARATRDSFWGRRWELTGVGFAYTLVPSGHRPRHWAVTVGGEPTAHVRGRLFSYNRVDFDAPISLPLVAAILAWHVVARPWEATAFAPELIRREDAAPAVDLP